MLFPKADLMPNFGNRCFFAGVPSIKLHYPNTTSTNLWFNLLCTFSGPVQNVYACNIAFLGGKRAFFLLKSIFVENRLAGPAKTPVLESFASLP